LNRIKEILQKKQVENETEKLIQPIIEFHSGSNIMECFADCFLSLIENHDKNQQPKTKVPVPSAVNA